MCQLLLTRGQLPVAITSHSRHVPGRHVTLVMCGALSSHHNTIYSRHVSDGQVTLLMCDALTSHHITLSSCVRSSGDAGDVRCSDSTAQHIALHHITTRHVSSPLVMCQVTLGEESASAAH
jgi:hypothetical protein